jgi:hypothetical protein
MCPPGGVSRWLLLHLDDQGDAGLGPPLFDLKGMPAGYKAGRDRAIAKGWLWFHESGIA